MLRSMLVGLDCSPDSEAAVELGLRWARRFEAMLVGIGIIDEPTICKLEPVALGGGPYKAMRDAALLKDARRRVEEILEKFALRCAEGGVACKLLEDTGMPSEQILLESQRFDLILLGRESHFHFETQDRADNTLIRVLKHGPRPVVAVPKTLPEGGEAAVVAYDGSLQAARALFAFWSAGLAESMPVHVVSVHRQSAEAAARSERAMQFLQAHGIPAERHVVETDHEPAAAILEKAKGLNAGLIVAGAFGQRVLREFFLGSVTRTLLREGEIPLFLTH